MARLVAVLSGIVLGQGILYGPSLAGKKILLPLDLLALPGVYLPQTPEVQQIQPRNVFTSDPVYAFEPARHFAASEWRAGRLPRWAPYHFAGAPFTRPVFSPFFALESCTESAVILAWGQLAVALVAGLGMYLFCRRALATRFWPALICSWCYPLTGFFVFWQGCAIATPVSWLPWLLLAVDKTVRGTSRLAPVGISAATGLTLVSGQLDVAGQVLLVSGLYAAWCFFDAYGNRWRQRQAARAALALTVGWGLGFFLAAPQVLPLLEYSQTGARMARRGAGEEERPPAGLSALPQIVLPDMYGTMESDSFRLVDGNQVESTATAYAGVLATLVVAPLAWSNRRRGAACLFWAGLAFFALSWSLNVPGLVSLLRLPGLNMLSHNRFVFAASFAILALTAMGLQTLLEGAVRWRWWLGLAPAVLGILLSWCVFRATELPEPVATQLASALLRGETIGMLHDLEGLRRVQDWFTRHYAAAAVGCGLGLAAWWLLRSKPSWHARLVPPLGVFLLADLLWFGFGRSQQTDPAFYFPRIPVLAQVAQSVPGRVIGSQCLPAILAPMCGLRDIRGYDAVDPARLIALMDNTFDPAAPKPPYALTQWAAPKLAITPDGAMRLSSVLDMLNVRYVIFRGASPPEVHPAFQGQDYWVLVNPAALPRPFIPHRVEAVTNDATRLEKLAAPQFDPREVAYVEIPLDLPAKCTGTAELIDEIPTRITISTRMETPGLVVLADLWDKGWRAYMSGRPVPILRVNHAVRGVLVPVGEATIQFRYEPASFTWGLRLCALSAVTLLSWAVASRWGLSYSKSTTVGTDFTDKDLLR